MPRVDYPSRDALFDGLARDVELGLHAALARQAFATLSIPGGSTPGPFFDRLSQADLDWARVRVILGDERFVPQDHDRSNARLVRARLLQNRAAAAQWIPLYAPAAQAEDVIDEISERVAEILPLDVTVVGMGEDMHTASIFPGADQLDLALAPEAPPVLAMRAPGALEPRITLSAQVLRGSKQLHLLIAGAAKAAALNHAQTPGDWAAAPVRAILSAVPEPTIHYAD